MKKFNIKNVVVLLFTFVISVNLFADDISPWVPELQKSMNAGNNISIRYEYSKQYNSHSLSFYYKNVYDLNLDVLAIKSNQAQMEIVARYRQLNPTMDFHENYVNYYIITIDKNGHASSEKINSAPDLKGFYCFPATVNDNKVNFRDKPDLKGNVKGQYQENAPVEFMGKLENFMKIGEDPDYWYNFNYNGTEKWIFGRWLNFPRNIELKSEYFSKAQEFAKSEIADVSNSKKITDLPFENTSETLTQIDSYKAGNSELQIIYVDYDQSDCKIIKNNEIISTIQYARNPMYSPVSKCLYYFTYDSNTLNAVSIETGKAVSLYEENSSKTFDDIYITGENGNLHINDEGSFTLNKAKDKLFYLTEGWSVDESRLFILESVDLATKKHTKVDLSSVKEKFPEFTIYDFCPIDDNNFYLTLYDYRNNETVVIAWCKNQNGKAVLVDSISFTDALYYSYTYKFAGNEILFTISIDDLYKTLILHNDNSGKIKYENFDNGYVENSFIYNGVEYIAFSKYDKQYADSYTISIYEAESLKQIMTKTFKPINRLWGINTICVQNGKILIEDYVCK